MIPVLVVSHGSLADGLRDAIEMILGGPQEGLATLALNPEEDPSALAARVDATLIGMGVDASGPAIVLADMFGASPANAAVSLLDRRPGLEVISGVNLGMALEVLMAREGLPPDELAALAVERGRMAVMDAGSTVREALRRMRAEKAARETT